MKKLKSILWSFAAVMLVLIGVPVVMGDVLINEYLPNPGTLDSDRNGTADETGDEFVELFNNGTLTVNISSWEINDSVGSKHRIPNGTLLASGAFYTVYGSNASTGSLGLNNGGDTIFLTNDSGVLLNTLIYDASTDDISTGRFPDGTSPLFNFTKATPNAKNDPLTPVLNVFINPNKNGSNISRLTNVTVNVTDQIYSVNQTRLVINSTLNLSMVKSGDIWFFGLNTTNMSDGLYNFTYFFNDSIGLEGSSSVLNITIDNTPPNVFGFNSPANGFNVSKNITLSVNINDTTLKVNTVYFNVSNGSGFFILPASNPTGDVWNATLNSSLLADGTQTVRIFANDTLNNINNSVVTTIKADNALPTGGFVTPLNSATVSGVIPINVTGIDSFTGIREVRIRTENVNFIQLFLNSGNFTNGAYNATVNTSALSPANGPRNLTLNLTDHAGNTNISTFITVILDNTAPNVFSINSPINNNNLSGLVVLNATANDTFSPISRLFFNVTQGNVSSALVQATNLTQSFWNTTLNTSALADGKYNISIYSNDTLGHAVDTLGSLWHEITVDNKAPNVIAFNQPLNNSNLSGIQLLNITANDTTLKVNTVYFNITNGTGFVIVPASNLAGSDFWNATINTALFQDGTQTVRIFANDTLNNINQSVFVNVQMDNTVPTGSFVTPLQGQNITRVIPINVSALDSFTGVASVSVQNGTGGVLVPMVRNSGNQSNGTYNITLNTSTLSNGPTNFTLSIVDFAGNTNSSIFVTATVDNAPPLFFNLNRTPAPNFNNESVKLNVTVNDSTLTVANVILESNFTGQMRNYTSADGLSRIGGSNNYEFNISAGVVPNGNFSAGENIVWRWYANDTVGNIGFSTQETFNVANRNPLFNASNPLQNQTKNENVNVIYNLSPVFSDLDLDNLTYNFTSVPNATISINNITGIATVDPDTNFAGNITIVFFAYDPLQAYNFSNNVTVVWLDINNAPVLISSIDDIVFPEDTFNNTISLANFFTDPEGSALTFGLFNSTNLNVNVFVNSTVGPVFLNATPNFFGQSNITFFARDLPGSTTLSNPVKVTVTSVNDAPTIALNITNSTIFNTTFIEDSGSFTFDLTQFEQEVDPYDVDANLSWNVSNFNSSLVIINITNSPADIVQFITVANRSGSTPFTLVLKDSFNVTTNVTLTATIIGVNDAPDINATIPNVALSEDTPATLDLASFKSDVEDSGSALVWSVGGHNSSLAQIFVAGNILTFVPQANASGSTSTTITLTDSGSLTDTQVITITVNGVNDAPSAPVLVSPSNNSVVVFNSTTLDWNDSADIDGTISLYYIFLGNTSTSIPFLGTSAASSISSGALQTNQTYFWYVKAQDNAGANSTNSSVFQFNVSLNNPPVITAKNPSSSVVTVVENTSQLFQINATDPEGGALTFNWSQNGSLVSSTNSFTFSPGFGQSGFYTVTATVKDNQNLTASDTWSVTVTNLNLGPTLSAIPAKAVNEDALLTFLINATDPDFPAEMLTYTSNNSLVTATKINETVANVTFTPAQAQVGTQSVTFTVTDSGALTSSRTVAITVVNVNGAPVITTSPAVTAVVNQTYSYDADATDEENNPITFSLTAFPAGMSINSASGVITWLPNSSQVGISSVTVSATDGINATTQPYNLTVSIVPNAAPAITSTAVTSAQVDTLYSYDVNANDANNDTLTFSLGAFPSGMNISNTTGLILWTPNSSQIGTQSVIARVFDGTNLVNQSFSVVVSKNQTSNLRITELDVEVGDEDDKDLNNGDKISEEAEPNDKIKFDIEVKNNGTLDMEDVSVQVEIEDIDDGDDIDEESDEVDIDSGDEEDFTVELEIPLFVDEKEYDVNIIVEGEDSNGTRHTTTFTLILEVEKENHKVIIRNADLSPSAVRCGDDSAIRVDAANIGADDEDDVAIEAVSGALGLNFKRTSIELDEGDDDDSVHNERIDVKTDIDTPAGDYPITIKAYYDGSKLSDTQTATLKVEECPTKTAQEVTPTQADITATTTFVQPVTTTTVAKDVLLGLEEDEYVTVLVITLALAMGGAAYLGMYLYFSFIKP